MYTLTLTPFSSSQIKEQTIEVDNIEQLLALLESALSASSPWLFIAVKDKDKQIFFHTKL